MPLSSASHAGEMAELLEAVEPVPAAAAADELTAALRRSG